MSVLTTHISHTTVLSGQGARKQLNEVIRDLPGKRPLLVTDSGLYNVPVIREVIDAIPDVTVFHEVVPNPEDTGVMKAAALYKENRCDCVIGIGGGSSMDTAKATSAIVRHEGFIMDYGRSTPNRKYFVNGREPLVLIPTTCGTGSEISPHAVITNTAKNRKSDLQEKIFYPDYIILDPDFLSGLPAKIMKDTGVDALCHAIEVYTSKKSIECFAPLHTQAALQCIRLVAGNLRQLLQHPDDTAAAERMQWAATLGGFSLDLDAALGHGLAGQLQKYHHDISHGASVGMLLPSTMAYNASYCPDRMRDIAEAFGKDTSGMNDEEASSAAVNAVRELLAEIGFDKLSDYMKDPAEIDQFYEDGAGNSCNRNNIRPVKAEEVRQVYLDAYHETYEVK